MNILLTGGAGYIGSCTANLLIDKGHQVTIIDNLSTGSRQLIPKKAKFFECNIQSKKVNEILIHNNFDLVMHFAAFIQVEESIKLPKKYLQNNFINSTSDYDLIIDFISREKIHIDNVLKNFNFNLYFYVSTMWVDKKNTYNRNSSKNFNPKYLPFLLV
jgi:UDP-glucose 4-epimerase